MSRYHFEGATPEKLARAMARTVLQKRQKAQKANKNQKKGQSRK
jgi:hypothetical protein